MSPTIFAPPCPTDVVPLTLARAVAGLAAAVLAAAIAWRTGTLTARGAIAAAACGSAAALAGWGWGALLVGYFAASVLLSRAGAARKAERTAGVVAKGGARDARQVLANGGVFAVLAVLAAVAPAAAWWWGAAGALAASAADTWATELGTLYGGSPRSIVSQTVVLPGESGGVTAVGFAGAALGAGFVGGVAALAGWGSGAALASLGAGVCGAVADSVLGATVQERFHCDGCGTPTERRVHGCGRATRRVGGIAGLDNDVVNLVATLTGGAVALGVYGVMRVSSGGICG